MTETSSKTPHQMVLGMLLVVCGLIRREAGGDYVISRTTVYFEKFSRNTFFRESKRHDQSFASDVFGYERGHHASQSGHTENVTEAKFHAFAHEALSLIGLADLKSNHRGIERPTHDKRVIYLANDGGIGFHAPDEEIESAATLVEQM